MKQLIQAALFSLLSCSIIVPAVSYADPGGSCHFHGSKPATESTILKCASQRKDSLVKNGKLEKNWGPTKPASIAEVDGKKGKEWKVTFVNLDVPDEKKANLFMFFTLTGNFIAANYTGQ